MNDDELRRLFDELTPATPSDGTRRVRRSAQRRRRNRYVVGTALSCIALAFLTANVVRQHNVQQDTARLTNDSAQTSTTTVVSSSPANSTTSTTSVPKVGQVGYRWSDSDSSNAKWQRLPQGYVVVQSANPASPSGTRIYVARVETGTTAAIWVNRIVESTASGSLYEVSQTIPLPMKATETCVGDCVDRKNRPNSAIVAEISNQRAKRAWRLDFATARLIAANASDWGTADWNGTGDPYPMTTDSTAVTTTEVEKQ